ncbi:TPA: DinI-like family protein [Escherichia coli]|nr:DinI-like family protein [Escherichia coli]
MIIRRNLAKDRFTVPKTQAGTNRVIHLIKPAIDALRSQMALTRLQQEMLRRVSKRYDDVEVIIKSTSNDGLSVTRTADKDSAKTFVQETLKDTWESADEWFVR